MKYLIISFLMIIGLNANDNLTIYKQQVKSLMNYTLKKQSHIYNMFLIQKPVQIKNKKIKKKVKHKIFKIKPKNTIKLIAILDNKVCLKINKIAKWAKIGDKVGDYKIVKILNNNSIIILDNKKMKILSINNKSKFKIKVR